MTTLTRPSPPNILRKQHPTLTRHEPGPAELGNDGSQGRKSKALSSARHRFFTVVVHGGRGLCLDRHNYTRYHWLLSRKNSEKPKRSLAWGIRGPCVIARSKATKQFPKSSKRLLPSASNDSLRPCLSGFAGVCVGGTPDVRPDFKACLQTAEPASIMLPVHCGNVTRCLAARATFVEVILHIIYNRCQK